MGEARELICGKCNQPLKMVKTEFKYLGSNFFAEIPKCESCGQVWVSEELVKGKIEPVEKELEDK